jgi:cytosine/adenosine deaminase-related metal-dependent hydrolase
VRQAPRHDDKQRPPECLTLALDRQIGDFAQADVLIEDGKIREVRPGIDVSSDSVAVVDAANRIVIPGFIDTHNHTYQGLLRSALSNGLLNPDYNRDVQNVLTPAYTAMDAYAGVLLSALGMIDMGTTGIVDLSQVSHSPDHSDACIRALLNPGHVDTVFIAGRVRKWHGSLVGVDMARVLRLAQESREAVFRRANYTVNFLS